MDAEVAGALDLLELNTMDAERFFATVVTAHADSSGDWDGTGLSLTEAARILDEATRSA